MINLRKMFFSDFINYFCRLRYILLIRINSFHLSWNKCSFLGEGHGVDILGPESTSDNAEQGREIVQHLIHGSSPLVDPKSVVNLEHLLLLLQLGVACRQVNFNIFHVPSGCWAETTENNSSGVHLVSLLEVNQAIISLVVIEKKKKKKYFTRCDRGAV